MIEPAAHRTTATGYRERLRTPWWWYPAGIVVGVLLGAEFIFVLPDSLAWLPIVLSILLSVLVVWRISSATVAVQGTELVVPGRRLPVSDIAEIYSLSYSELRRVVGRHGDPHAFNFIRSWVGPGVQLVLAGERPAEPYWLISTRHPDRLIAAISAAAR